MEQTGLINLLNKLEKQGHLAKSINAKIQDFLDYNTKNFGKIFLIVSALIGASFISAGIYDIISNNWDDFPKHLKGIFSLIPSLVALYFYYLALFTHKYSVVWTESSSLFLMVMMGISIVLINKTYDLGGEYHDLIKILLILSLPLFYLSRASGYAILYLGLTSVFLFPKIEWSNGFQITDQYAFFWIFFLGFLPHFISSIDRKSSKQGIRTIYLGWLVFIILFGSLTTAFKGGYLFWGVSMFLGFYLIGKKYFGSNLSFIARPFQTGTFYMLFGYLLYFSVDVFQSVMFKAENLRYITEWDAEKLIFYFLGFIVMIILGGWAYSKRNTNPQWNRYIIFLPILSIFSLSIYYLFEFDILNLKWLSDLVLNLFILGFAINAMIKGNRNKNMLYMFYGLFLSGALMWIRYFDMSYSFWIKGLFFIAVGVLFFLINYLSHDELDLEQ